MDMDIVTENVSLGEIAATVFVSAALLLIMAGVITAVGLWQRWFGKH